MITIMQPSPFHLLSAIFAGQVEPWYPRRQMLIIIDEWDDLAIRQAPLAGLGDNELRVDLSDLPAVREASRSLHGELIKSDPFYATGLFLQGTWMDESADHGAHLRLHHAMPYRSLLRGKDSIQLCVRQAEIEAVIPDSGLGSIWRTPSLPFMTQFGVLDEAKLRDVALDLGVSQLLLKNSHSFWNVNPQPHRMDGQGGPGWTLWSVPATDEDF